MASRLLLVDDEPEIQRALEQVLRSDDYEITTAASGVEGLAALQRAPADVVISDCQMPGMSGVEFLTQVRQLHPDTLCLMLSAQGDLDMVIEAMNQGTVHQFVTKPWSNVAVRTLVGDAVRQARQGLHSRDPATGCFDKRWFCRAVDAHLADASAPELMVVFAEVQSPAKSLSMMRAEEIRELAAMIVRRCRQTAPLRVDVSAIDRYLFAFAVALPDSDDQIEELLATFDQHLKVPMALPSGQLTLTFRYAVVAQDDELDDSDEVLRRGLVALSSMEADDQVRVRRYSKELVARLHQRYTLEQDLYRAVKRDQLFCLFQPQVDARTLEPRGAETLVRWQHPMQGLVSPLLFIDLAERNGVIHELGIWVMRQAFALQMQLSAQGRGTLYVSANVSPRQFSDRALLDGLRALRAEFDIDPSRIEIEITESTMMSDPRHALRVLEELKELGFRLALDDFGTGYSSLGQLQRMPLDVVKFDRMFVQSVEEDPVSRTLLKHVAALAVDLQLEVIAEGIETSAQADICRDLGCHLLQGYLFAKPLSLDDYLQYLDAALPKP